MAAVLAEVAEQYPLGVFIVDRAGAPVFINKVGTGLLGMGVIGAARAGDLALTYHVHRRSTGDVCSQDSLPVVRALAGEIVIDDDLMIRRDDADVPIRVMATPIRGEAGCIEAAVAVFWDSTEENEASRVLSAMFEKQGEVAQELEQLREMRQHVLTAVNHEFRTPLTTLLGALDVLHENHERLTVEERADLLERARRTARQLKELVTNVLDVSGGDMLVTSGEHVFDLAQSVAAVVADVDLGSRPLVLTTTTAPVRIDKAQFERAVRCLIDNVARHTPSGTRVWVSTYAEGNEAIVEVTDTGPGIPEPLRRTVLEPYGQGPEVQPHDPGLGIGLAVARRFTERHRGRIYIDDRPGGGTRVRLFIPR